MKENYNDLSKEELIEKLKSKDEQITEMEKRYNNLKADVTEEIEKAKLIRFQEFEELKNKNDLNNATISELKETIVLMSIRSFGSQESMFNIFRGIDKKLDILNKTLCGNNKQGCTKKGW